MSLGMMGLLLWSNVGFGALSIGHRGYSLVAPENTLSAFRAALPYADLVETDTQPSADGVLMLMHDGKVDRTTDGTGSLSSMTAAQLKALDAGSWFSSAFVGERIPSMIEMITNTLPWATPLIERKAGTAQAHVTELASIDATTKVVLQSFDWDFLAQVHALEPRIRLCALGNGVFSLASLTSITNSGARIVAWEAGGVNPAMIDMVHTNGLQVFVWTVDGPAIKTFLDLGVDGVISNDPRMVRTLQQGGAGTNVVGTVTNLASELISYWRFDDGLTNPMAAVVFDSKGFNSQTLTRTDGLSHWLGSEAAKFDGGLQVDGVKSYVVVSNSPSLDIGTNELSLSVWLWLKRLPSQLSSSFAAIYDSSADCYVFYLDKANKELRFKVSDISGAAARPGIPESFLLTNQWIHMVATYSGNEAENSGRSAIYLNGELVDLHYGNDGTAPVGLTNVVKSGQIAAIGREGPTGANYFDGRIDDLAIWKRALTASEVAGLYQAGQGGRSLRDLLGVFSPTIQLTFARMEGTHLEVEFRNLAYWKNFRLLRSPTATGPFVTASGAVLTSLGRNNFRFTCALNGEAAGYFRVEGE